MFANLAGDHTQILLGIIQLCAVGVGLQLKIVTWANEEVASDALSIHGYEHYQAADYALSAWYPPRPKQAALPDQAQQRGTARSSDVTKWWADGDEPLYYIVSSKARLNLALPHKHAPVSSCMQALLQGCPVDVLCSLL